MSKQNETGHAINVANFEDLISFCTGYGTAYNPTKERITLTALSTKQQATEAASQAVNNALPVYTNAVNARELLFKPLKKLVTRIPYAVKASDAAPNVAADVTSIVRKLQGTRATPKAKDNPATPQNEAENSISASQLSFDSRVQNLDKLNKLLASIPAYKPNETELTVASLTSLHGQMKAANSAVINSVTPLSNSRIARIDDLYNANTGLLAIVNDVKDYLKSVFTANSPQYKQVSKLKFVQYKP